MAKPTLVMKFGGTTMQGKLKFGPNEDALLDECLRLNSVRVIYQLLAQRRNSARANRLRELANKFIIPSITEESVPVVVVSAFDWATDKLDQFAAAISSHPSPREYARLLMSGEQRANSALAMTLEDLGVPARSLTGREAGIVTDERPTKALVERVDVEYVQSLVDRRIVPVVAGFQGYYHDDTEGRNEVSILGRGGSNLTAVALAHFLGLSECTMFTDVDGIYDKDPNVAADARKLDEVTAEELFRWEKFPRVIQDDAVRFAMQQGVNVWIRDGNDATRPGSLIRCRQ